MVFPRLVRSSVAAVKSCSSSGTYVIQTQDHRFIVGIYEGPDLEITTTVYNALGKDEECLGMDVCSNSIVIWSAYRICIINLRITKDIVYRITGLSFAHHTFPHRINLVRCGFRCTVIRTDGGLIYSLGYHSSVGPRLVRVPNSLDVLDIVMAFFSLLITMDDARPQICRMIYESNENNETEVLYANTVTPIEFPLDVRIAKTVSENGHNFFITTKGECYYSYTNNKVNTDPVLIKSLLGCMVTSIFVTVDGIIILHDANKLCLLKTEYWGITEPTAICVPQLDRDESIITVVCSCFGTYIITDWGRVYRSPDIRGPIMARIKFFDESPLEIETDVPMIKSSLSYAETASYYIND